MRWEEHAARMEEIRNTYKTLVGKLEWDRADDGKTILKGI
jgi:hypothetical protein